MNQSQQVQLVAKEREKDKLYVDAPETDKFKEEQGLKKSQQEERKQKLVEEIDEDGKVKENPDK